MARSSPGRCVRSFAARGLVVAMGFWLVLTAAPASAAPIHVDCGAGGNLQNKIDGAPGGSTILVKGTCDGPFTIGFKSLTIRGNPTATLDGQGVGTTLSVNVAGKTGPKTVTLIDLTITGGQATGQGGGILVDDASLHLLRTTVKGNRALGSDYSYGGGIAFLGSGTLTLDSSRVTGNRALTEPATGFAYANGGAIYSEATVTLTDSIVSGNIARATSTDSFAYVYGGAIEAGTVVLAGSTVANNVGRAHSEAQFAYAYGGALELGNLTMTGSSVTGNRGIAVSDADFAYGYGGGIDLGSGGSTVAGSNVSGNLVSATALDFAVSYGGGINSNGGLTLEHSSVLGNTSQTNATGSYASSSGGGISAGSGVVTLKRSTVGRNVAAATSDGDDASAFGGGIGVPAPASLAATNSTIAVNRATADSTGAGKTGSAAGGGAEGGSMSLLHATVAANVAEATGDTVATSGGGVNADTLTTKASILAANNAATGPDCSATTTSQGSNLVLHPAGCLPAPKPSDVTGKPPKLGVLENNGGPTLTMAIPTTSPAFNHIPGALCAVPFDQRGIDRPQGPRCDIGAFERNVP